MEKKNGLNQAREISWLAWFFVAFGVQLGYIALILVVEELCGAMSAFLPLMLMPLFECLFGGIYSLLLYRRCSRKSPVLLSALGSLLGAGLLYELASGILNGWGWDAGVFLYDFAILVSLLLGLTLGIRLEGLRRKIHQRRTRFDD